MPPARANGTKHEAVWYSELYLSLADRNFYVHGGDELRLICDFYRSRRVIPMIILHIYLLFFSVKKVADFSLSPTKNAPQYDLRKDI